jgi:hypothetical protein
MQLPINTRNTIGCLNLTHYSFCRYCAYDGDKEYCDKFRIKYYRNKELLSSTSLYRRLISYEFSSNVLESLTTDYSDDKAIKNLMTFLKFKVGCKLVGDINHVRK